MLHCAAASREAAVRAMGMAPFMSYTCSVPLLINYYLPVITWRLQRSNSDAAHVPCTVMSVLCGLRPAARGPCSAAPVVGIINGTFGFANYEMPVASPLYGCNYAASGQSPDPCLSASSQYSMAMAYDSTYFSDERKGAMSYPIPSAEFSRFKYVFFQVKLDREYR